MARGRTSRIFVALASCGSLLAIAAAAQAAGTLRMTTLPPRPADAPTGSQFAERADGLGDAERQRAAVGELERGNVPGWLRELQPVELRQHDSAGHSVDAVVWVTPDYLRIGPDEDSLTIPLSLPSATDVARRLDCVLPTPKIVDAIYQQAAVRLEPRPLPAGPQMRTIGYAVRHEGMIDAQRAGQPFGALIAGHMKDVVLTNRLAAQPDRVAIYGWHEPDGRPIQPLSTVHGVRYADYSHGVRLVWHEVQIGGEMRSIYDVLADPEQAGVLSYEGVVREARAILDPSRAAAAAAATAPERR